MKDNILEKFLEKEVLLDKGTLNLLEDFDDESAKNIITKIAGLKEKIITKSFFSNNVEKISELIEDEKIVEKLKIDLGLSFEISRERLLKKSELKSEEGLEEKVKGKELKLGHIKVIYSLVNLELYVGII